MHTGKYLNVKPTLAVEILSPGQDVSDKVTIYLKAGVDAIWVVDPERRTVLVYADREKRTWRLHESEISLPAPLRGLVKVGDIFAGIPGQSTITVREKE